MFAFLSEELGFRRVCAGNRSRIFAEHEPRRSKQAALCRMYLRISKAKRAAKSVVDNKKMEYPNGRN